MLSRSSCGIFLFVLRFGPLMAAIQMDFNIHEEKCLIGRVVKNFILHLKCRNSARNEIQRGDDSCLLKPYKKEDVVMDITPGSTDIPCQMTREMMKSKRAFCVNVHRECHDRRYDINTSAMFHGNHTGVLSLTLALNSSHYFRDRTKNVHEIFNISLEANVTDADCRSKTSCAWSAHNMQWHNNQEIIHTGSITQLGFMNSPWIFGSTGSTCLKWKMEGLGNVSVFVNTNDSESSFAMKTYFVQNNTLEYTWKPGEIRMPFAVRFRLHGAINNSIKISNIAFSTCGRESIRNCTFEMTSSCPLIESYHGCSLHRTKGDPHKDINEWMLLTRKDYCKDRNKLTSAFSTVSLPPVLGSNTCQVLLKAYGNLLWYWRICLLNNVCSNRTIPDRIDDTTYTFPISNISQRYKLEFSTVHLDSRTFLGIIKLAFSESCFHNSSSNTIVPLDFTQEHNTQVSPSVFMVIAILVLCLLILFIISLGIVRKRRRFCLNYKSTDANDRKVSIHDFLATKTVEKTLENILTEGNPNYRWYCHRLLKGTIVDIDKSQIQIHTLLGRGAFGEVFRGILLGRERNGKNTDIAIKRLSKSADQQSQDDFLLEALILFKFQHKNIVKCLGISSSNGVYMILLELMLGGDLKTFLRNTKDKQTQKSTLKISELLRLASDVACGLNYLESLHFVHRDVAARNCLLTNLGPNRIAKLGDFGMAKDILMNDYYRKEGTALLPIRWMPPEAFLEGYFSCKSDVWAFGVLMWEIFTSGFIPYPGLQNNAVMTFVNKGGRLEMPALCTQSIYDLMSCCWQSDPMERPSFQTVYRFLIMTHKKLQNEESMSGDKCNEDKSSPRYCSKVFNEEESSPLMLIDEICRGGM